MLEQPRTPRQQLTWHYENSPQNISRYLRTIVERFIRAKERTLWWDAETGSNTHPMKPEGTNFFSLPWLDKVRAGKPRVYL
jgi:hypothetical protein